MEIKQIKEDKEIKYNFRTRFHEFAYSLTRFLHSVRSFFFRVGKLFRLVKFFWGDRWWDAFYLERLIVWKLRDMSRNFKEHGNTVSSGKRAREMAILANELEKVAEENAEDAYFDTLNLIEGENGFKKLEGYDSEKHKEVMIYMQKRRERIYKIISKRINYWWD